MNNADFTTELYVYVVSVTNELKAVVPYSTEAEKAAIVRDLRAELDLHNDTTSRIEFDSIEVPA